MSVVSEGGYVVAFRVLGHGAAERFAGPYETEREATSHAADIRGYELVEYADVVPLEATRQGRPR